MRVMVLYERSRTGDRAVELARELAHGSGASLTLVGVVPQAEGGGPRCGGSALLYNVAVMEQVAEELHAAKRRLGEFADDARIELLIEGSDPPLVEWSATHNFDTILLPARRRPLRSAKHPDAERLLRGTGAEVRVIDARGGDAARS
jgi:nucleotide-binding universal stress UspA family protein